VSQVCRIVHSGGAAVLSENFSIESFEFVLHFGERVEDAERWGKRSEFRWPDPHSVDVKVLLGRQGWV